LEFEFLINVVDLQAEFLLDPRESDLIRERRDIILKFPECDDERQGQEVRTGAHRLPDLDESGAEFDQFFLQPDRLFFLIYLAVHLAAEEEPSEEVHELMEEPKTYAVKLFTVNRHPGQTLSGVHSSFGVPVLAFDVGVELIEVKIERELPDHGGNVCDPVPSANAGVPLFDLRFAVGEELLFSDQLLIRYVFRDRQVRRRGHRMVSVTATVRCGFQYRYRLVFDHFVHYYP
jgi:hypothetical protein